MISRITSAVSIRFKGAISREWRNDETEQPSCFGLAGGALFDKVRGVEGQ